MCRVAVCKKCGEEFKPDNARGPAPWHCQACRSRKCLHCGNPITRKPRADEGKDAEKYCGQPCFFAAVNAGTQRFKGRTHDAWAAMSDWAYEWDAQRPRARKQRQRKPRPSCQHCGKECKEGASRFCSYECVKSWRGTRACDICGIAVHDANAYSKCRCDSCKNMARKQAKRRAKTKYGRNHRQRARHHGVRYVAVEVRAIYERDGWRCQICKRKCRHSFAVSKSDGRPHPRSPTVDHIRSMKDGGAHEPANLQLACFECNTNKGAASRGQLRLAFV